MQTIPENESTIIRYIVSSISESAAYLVDFWVGPVE